MGKRRKRAAAFPAFGARDPLLDAGPRATLDLHGDTALDAERRVADFIRTQARVNLMVQSLIFLILLKIKCG